MAVCDQSLPNVRAVTPYLPGKPITQLALDLRAAVYGMTQWQRVTIGTEQENLRFLEALDKAV